MVWGTQGYVAPRRATGQTAQVADSLASTLSRSPLYTPPGTTTSAASGRVGFGGETSQTAPPLGNDHRGAQDVLSPPPGAVTFRDGQWYAADGTTPVYGRGNTYQPGNQDVNHPPPGAFQFLNGTWYDAHGRPVADPQAAPQPQVNNAPQMTNFGAANANYSPNSRILASLTPLVSNGTIAGGNDLYQRLYGDLGSQANQVINRYGQGYDEYQTAANLLNRGQTAEQIMAQLDGASRGELTPAIINQIAQTMMHYGISGVGGATNSIASGQTPAPAINPWNLGSITPWQAPPGSYYVG